MRRKSLPSPPYARARSGGAARDEIAIILRRLGCESVGFMDDYAKCEVLLTFVHRGQHVQLRASAHGWAALFLKAKPWTPGLRCLRHDYEAAALAQGHVAVNSILRDWIKGQVTAIECGILSFEAVFLPFMLTADGRPLIDRAMELLPAPDDGNVVTLAGRS